ncbi:RecQ family ATP-dependent DNA helicase [Cellulomonas sp. KRMCY2]|uniref:RecQ family ATP-dependent DNA helicase n=1 Tax=Cellulomonas sp. KRMCY2 TaxID=1304865 RepID=UPI00045EA0DC|nr:DEAD/DEAH box helicase [Cellulomonas sp. KRMCY2]
MPPDARPHDLPARLPSSAALRARAEEVLRRLVGRQDAVLREDQWSAIEALVADRRRTLVVQRTGWGKSAVYFVATALLREQGSGPTVIVSPLLALMRNQVDAARRAGIAAETIHSANTDEWEQVHDRVAAGTTDVLLVSPERLNNPGFRDEVLPRLAHDAGLLVVDEAHCISDWGHDFRPDYRRIRTLLAELPPGTPVLATTATANARVTADVAEQLAHHGAQDPDAAEASDGLGQAAARDADAVLVLRGSLDRESLHLAVRELPDHAAQLAWLTTNLPAITGSGIVYCLTVAAAEQVAAHLRGAGLAVRSYTGQTDPAERLLCEQDLLDNRVKALVATSALGMGFDKPDLGFVVHLGAPSSPIAYYQQVGRAGRATERAEVVLLPGRDDRAIWDWFASMAFPPEQAVRATLAALDGAHGPMSTAALEPMVDLRRNRLELMLKVLDVDGAVHRVRGGWESTGQSWSYDAERYARVATTRRAEQDAMLDYVATRGCRMAFLRAALDDPDLDRDEDGASAWRCGRCDRCGGWTQDAAPEAAAVAAARAALAVPGVELTPRRQWPSGMSALGIELSGRIVAGDGAEAGRGVARLDGLGWGGALREMFAVGPGGGTVDGPLPVGLRAVVTEVLDAWRDDLDGAIDGVVVIRSATRPVLTDHLAAGVARHLGVPLVGAVVPDPALPPGRHDVNSAQRLSGVVRRLRLDLTPAAAAGLAGRSVLLVDDRYDTGWTMTVAARLLRRAGARAVHPWVLAVG